MTTISPSTGGMSLSGVAPAYLVDLRLVPGEANMVIGAGRPRVTVDTRSLLVNLPSMLATFTERRRLIRETTDELRDIVFQGRDTELYMALELNGDVYDVANLTDVELVYEDTNGTSGTVTTTSHPAVFDLSSRAVVRGQTVNVLHLVLDDAFIAELFTTGLWTVEVFGYDADHPGGALWGALEWEIRALFDGVVVVPNVGSMTFTEYAPTVRYDRAATLTGSMVLSGNQPSVDIHIAGLPSTGALSLSGVAPSLLWGNPQPGAGQLQMGGLAPTLT